LNGRMVITIDGPAGAGKSSVARGLAQRLGFEFLDTGAMYRCVALAGKRAGVDWSDPRQLERVARAIRLDCRGDVILLDGEDVSREIRSPEVTSLVVHAAGNREIREILVAMQRRLAGGRDMVSEGRDQGTIVFPEARCKIFLTASPIERARRRWREVSARGETTTLEEVLEQQNLRDAQDADRALAPLRPAADAVEVCSDGLTADEVLRTIETIVSDRRHGQ